MKKVRALLSRMAALFGQERRDRDLADELESHIAMHTEDNLRARLPPEEARRQALIKLGGVEQTKQRYRARRSLPWLESLFADLRYATRMLARGRGFTLVLVLILALGIGGVTAIYTVVDGVLLRPLPFPHPEEIMAINGLTYPPGIDPLEYWGHNPAFDQITSSSSGGVSVMLHHRSERTTAALVSYNFFAVLGVKPLLGRASFSEKDAATFAQVAVLSYGFWVERFAKDSSVAGKTILVNDLPYTIIGVMPASFRFPEGAELWMPYRFEFGRGPITLGTSPSDLPATPPVIGRLKHGVTIRQADTIMTTLARRLQAQYGNAHHVVANKFIAVHPLQEEMVGDFRTLLLMLLAAVGFVLLIVCANAANMLLSRAVVRQKEIALRLCLGATRFRIVRQLLTESVLLALIGGGLGILLARWFVGIMRAIAPANIPRMAEATIDPRILACAVAISSLTGIVVGLMPALQSLAPELTRALKAEGQRSTGGLSRFSRGALVVTEVALSLVLVSGTGLMLQSLHRMMETPLHFNPKNVVTMDLDMPASKFAPPTGGVAAVVPRSTTGTISAAEQKREEEQAAQRQQESLAAVERFNRRLLEKVRSIPGVVAASTVSALPFTGRWGGWFVYPEGAQADKDDGMGQIVQISGDYFRAMGVSLIAGRAFTKEEELSSAHVIILGENLARGLWPHASPIGQRLILETGDNPAMEIVGIAPELTGDFRGQKMRIPAGEMYLPGSGGELGTLVVRTALNPTNMMSPIREVVLSLDPDLTAYNARTMQEVISTAAGSQSFRALILGFFAAMALILAVLGVYGVMAYSVASRTHEIGVRISLGADGGRILRLIVFEGMRLAAIGVAVGLALALALNQLLTSLLFGTSPADPATLALAAGLLIAGALAACLVPARRAMRVDPMVALRHE